MKMLFENTILKMAGLNRQKLAESNMPGQM
jgi:hypothetical protein